MNRLLFGIYKGATRAYFTILHFLAALGHSAARQRVQGLSKPPKCWKHPAPGDKVVWFHCASAGELEQAIPILERLRYARPEAFLLVTVFSGSGFNFALRKKDWPAHALAFLPDDRPEDIRRFLNQWNPTLAIFVKYEFWWGILNEVRQRGIPLFLISAHFTPRHKRLLLFFRRVLPLFTKIWVQDGVSQKFVEACGAEAEIVGDTRVDRVLDIRSRRASVEQAFSRPAHPLVVLGSVWPQDMPVLEPVFKELRSTCVCIVCPHKPREFLQTLETQLKKLECETWERVSELLKNARPGLHVLLEMGVLSWLYGLAEWAYVGGGFGRGVHNTLEAAVWRIPVFCGPRVERFREALELQEAGVLRIIEDARELKTALAAFNVQYLEQVRTACDAYFLRHAGASDRITHQVLHVLDSNPEPN
ncbi:MAG: hypothetical protein NZM15_00630 [Flavobacteriales bacterium]|nr:hypothetical protein [Flavobacteriales bacterium]MDW8431188.1 glycosyltransferase N-terminal domain-containing protein [Flavobacteriales bacterium]